MTIQELEKIMQEHGAVIRAIPLKVRMVLEAAHAKDCNDGEVRYLEEFHRKMFVREYVPENAGKFLIESVKNTGTTVWFQQRFFDSIEDAVIDLVNGKAGSPNYRETKGKG